MQRTFGNLIHGFTRNHRFRRVFTVLVILGLIAPGVQGPAMKTATARSSLNNPISQLIVDDPASGNSAGGLQITLSEGSEQPTTAEPLPVAPGEPLAAEAIQPILDRLPPLETEPTDQQDFRLPTELLPPPRPGATITQTFPPTGTAPATAEVVDGPLEVLRFAPEGEIPIAPFLSVTFNQPMVPLTTLAELSAADVPVKITPELTGTWKWLGTKTLTFEYKSADAASRAGGETAIDRFPKATEYTVEIPAGTQSATGNELAEAVTWTFRTPAPVMEYTYPSGGPQPLNPLIFVSFDQQIDPAAVLETVSVTAGGEEYAVQLADDAAVADNAAVSGLVKRTLAGRWLAFRADKEFPAGTTVTVNIGPNTPSAEGPLTTEAVQSFSYTTYSLLRIEEHGCSWGDQECPPFTPFYIRFNNPLDEQKFDPALITIEPAIPDLIVQAMGTSLELRGATQGRTTYEVTVSGEIADVFGQTLGEAQTLTFKTGPATALLTGPNNNFVTLDPSAGKPTFTIYTVNYDKARVRAFAVTPEQWAEYQTYLNNYAYEQDPPDPPGDKVLDEVQPIEAVEDELVETNIDLSQALSGSTGHLIVVVDVPLSLLSSLLSKLPFGANEPIPTVRAWVQVTQIGLDAFADHSEMVAWATRLQDGTPLAEVEVSLLNSTVTATTDESGLARFPLPDQPAPVLVGKLGDDVAMLPQNTYYWGNGGWMRNPLQDELRWYVFDDRQMYRPGEEVHVKGWLRRIGAGQTGDVSLVGDSGVSLQYTVNDPQGNQLADGVLDVNDLGGFDFAFTLPENANLGYANIYLSARNVSGVYTTDYYHNFQIQEFRRPEFEVTARNDEKGPFFVGDDAVVAISAQYYAGGPLPGAETTWNVNSSPSNYSPPGWPDFTFGEWTPWWGFYDMGYATDSGPYSGGNAQSYTGRTDPAGVHYLRMNFDGIAPTPGADKPAAPRPYSVMAEGVVMDVNRQAWAATTSLLVHPADRYVGIRSDRTFVEQGEPLVIEAIVTDLDGNAFADSQITMQAARLEWRYNQGQWREEESDVQECTVASAMEPVSCEFKSDTGGSYRITASIRDDQERLNQSQFTRWVSGGQRPAARNVEQEQATLIPDKASYQPGDTAEILVQSPFSPAEGLLTVSRSGILSTERFVVEDGTYTLKVPIAEEHIPNLNIQVDLAGSAPRTDEKGEAIANVPPRPAYATGSLTLAVPPVSRVLTMTVAPAATELAPGVETSIAISLTNAAGEPVADAELAVVVVDEAVLALTNYQLADPIATFYSQRSSDMSSYYARASIVLANPVDLANQVATVAQESMARGGAMAEAAPTAAPMATESADMAFAAGGEAKSANAPGAQPQIALRSDFNPLAVFAPAVRTDENGQATIDFKLPDNLTRYRVMVVAVAEGKYFGMGEANMTARLPLMVRPSAPRFLNFGDKFELPVVVQNQTNDPLEVDVAVRAGNLTLPEGNGQRVTIPANDRVEVRFPATTDRAGTVRLQIAATSGDYADAATVELPVYTPATTEAFAVYGVVDEGAIAQPVASPQNVFPQFGGLEINTSSTALQALTDAVLYLSTYRFECTEQLASRILGIAALRDVLTAFEAEGLPTPEALNAAVQRDIERLQALQNDNGGWPVWERGDESVPYYSIHVAHALQMARMKDYLVPEEMMVRALDHLRNIENYYPAWYGESIRQTLSSYALYVRHLMGDADPAKARTLLNSKPLEDQSLEAIAWLWTVLADDAASAQEVEAIQRHINNRVVETAGAANFTTAYGEDAYLLLHSSRRSDAVILDALIQNMPESDLIPKVVNGLLAHRTAGRWDNTQENAFVLLAMDRYFNTFEAQTPDFVARIWLGETYAGEHTYEGRTTERHETKIPMSYLVENAATQDLILSKEGEGRLYYRLGLRYAPTDLNMPPVDMGFVVERTYEAVDDADDVQRDENGVWRIKAGARVRVRLSMVADNRRYHVALVDPLPAGLEAINPALAISENVPGDPNQRSYGWWWWSTWYDHQNLRDERAEAFATLLWDGVYTYSYVARATTPGEFVVPPAKAEEMYSPEVFGRSASDRVVVE
ncbi:MAG: alpha-2-macroglobulin family protein [Caldilineaceae bacterium]